MATIEVRQLQTDNVTEYPLNNMDDVMKIADRYPTLGRKLVGCPDMNSIVTAILKYLNSHGSLHAKIHGKINESALNKNEDTSFEHRFDAWLAERSENQRMYDTGWNADPGNQRKPEKKSDWLKSLFKKVFQ